MASLYDSASLVMIPSGIKEDKLYSLKPTDGSGDFTFSRGSDIQATRVNSSGLIEKAKVNDLLSSSDVSTQSTYWTANQGGVTTQNATTSPIGTNTATQITANGTNNYSGVTQNVTMSASRFTYSVYLKAVSGSPSVRLTCFDGVTFHQTDFTLTTSWERYSITFSAAAGTNGVYITSQDAVSWYAWGAQLNYGQVAQDYVETTTTAVVEGLTADLPRLDYSGGASCPSLLLEPSRTNSVVQSEYFNDSTNWFKYSLGSGSNPVVTDNYAVSPEGVTNAARLQLDAGGSTSSDRSRLYTNISVTSGTDYTFTFYAKSNTGNNEYLKPRAASVNYSEITITTEWQRFDVSFEASATGSYEFGFECRGNHTENAVDISIYGAQVEAGSYPTSYIPTYGTAANRGDEELSVLGQSSNIGQTSGTIFLESSALSDDNTNRVISLSDGTSSNRVLVLYQATSNTIRGQFSVSGQSTITIDETIDTTQNRKIAFAYDATSVVLYVDGSEVGTTSTGYTFSATLDDVRFDNVGGGNFIGNTKQFVLFPTKLTNAELASLTTI